MMYQRGIQFIGKKLFLALATIFLFLSTFSLADDMKKEPAFGGVTDIAYAKYLWLQLGNKNFLSTKATLYVGGPPHGAVREVLEGVIDGQRVIVKKNYGGDGVSIETVTKDRAKFLKAVTIMIKKPGYDPKNKDWFWVKFKADGTFHLAPNKMQIAGRGAGCIACHASASGTDMVFVHNKEANAEITLVGEINK